MAMRIAIIAFPKLAVWSSCIPITPTTTDQSGAANAPITGIHPISIAGVREYRVTLIVFSRPFLPHTTMIQR